jgi:hypothetical protein
MTPREICGARHAGADREHSLSLSLPDLSELQDPCNGVFRFRITTPNVTQQDVCVAFMGQSMLLASFTENLAQQGTYGYFYGVGLKEVGCGPNAVPRRIES